MNNKRYQLHERLGIGGMGAVYRAYDRLLGKPVALKRVTLTPERQSSSLSKTIDFRLALAQEFRTLASLWHPNIISVLDYGFDENQQPFYTMDLLDNAQTILKAGQDQPLATQVALLVQVFQALAYLHRHGIIHRDLKPENILVVQESGQPIVKVLDFGLAVVRGRRQSEEEEGVAGTLAYMAPEVLQGAPAHRGSDLYAAGMIAYEVLAGRHPFRVDQPFLLVQDVLETVPDVNILDLPEGLSSILRGLIEKDPRQRTQDAADVIQQYATITGQESKYETDAIRESFLKSAQFVGRDAELSQIGLLLQQALNGSGSLCLVHGESGVGKSRLLEQIRAQALVNGMLVLRGQSISETSIPYLLWREPLRLLALESELTPLQSSVLKTLLPDITTLVGAEVEDALQVDALAAQDRMLAVIGDLFRRQTRPTLVILEDLHWARQESLDVITALSRDLHQHPLVILGSYREDEKPQLTSLFPAAQLIALKRLAPQEIEAFSASILGDVGHHAELVDLLQRETEGNAYFLIEVIRALAEEAGDLQNVGRITLPERVFAGGMQLVIWRRLNRVPERFRAGLRLAAVVGRELDLHVLQAAGLGEDLPELLSSAAEAAVLEVLDGRWSFAHDKLRTLLLAELSAAERVTLNRQVAQAIETVYPQDPLQAAQLAHHWQLAGDTTREAHYTVLAGEQALHAGAHRVAASLLTRALELQSALPPLQRARFFQMLADAYAGVGEIIPAEQTLRQSLRLLHAPAPASTVTMLLAMVIPFLRQVWNRFIGVQPDRDPARALQIARLHVKLGELYFFNNNIIGSLYCTLAALNWAERGGPSVELALTYSNTSTAVVAGGLQPLGRFYRRKSIEVQQQVNPADLERAYILRGIALHDLSIADWAAFESVVVPQMATMEQAGDLLHYGEMLNIYAHALYDQGHYTQAMESWQRLEQVARRNNNALHLGWALVNQATGLITTGGDPAQVIRLAQEALDVHQYTNDKLTPPNCFGVLALAHLRRGALSEARAAADTGMALFQSRAVSPSCFISYVAIPGAYLGLWEQGDATSAPRMRQALGHLRAYAQVFHNGRPRAALYAGARRWLGGDPRRAERHWKNALSLAQAQAMPYEEALALRYLERVDPVAYGGKADAIFERLGIITPPLIQARRM